MCDQAIETKPISVSAAFGCGVILGYLRFNGAAVLTERADQEKYDEWYRANSWEDEAKAEIEAKKNAIGHVLGSAVSKKMITREQGDELFAEWQKENMPQPVEA